MSATANIEYVNSVITPPSAPTATGNTGSGSSFTAAQTVNVAITWVSTTGGETTASASTLVTISANGDNVVVTVPALPANTEGANVYASATSGGSTLYQAAVKQAAGSVTLTAFPSNTNPQPPSVNGAAVPTANVESGSALRFNKSDDIITTTTPITVPQSAGTNYSYVKWLGIYVTTAAATTLSNLSIALIAALTTGFALFAVGIADTGYVQAGTGTAAMTDNGTTDVTASGTTPTICTVSTTRLSTTPTVYDTTGGSANVTNQIVGKLCAVAFGVGNSYTGGGGAVYIGANSANSGVIVSYDEA